MPLNILFLCSRNKWRSPTGERAWARTPGVAARSAGTSRSARRRVTSADVHWADVIFVMEEKHKTALKAGFRNEITPKTVHVLDIPDTRKSPHVSDLHQAMFKVYTCNVRLRLD